MAGLPIVSPHGHVDARVLADDEPFTDPASLFVQPDHYVTRMLRAHGVSYDDLGIGGRKDVDPRDVWRIFCSHWWAFRGTPSRYWLESELVEVFGVSLQPSAENADALYDQISARLAEKAFRPRALYDRFRLEFLATTDDPSDDLAAHRRLAEDPTWTGRVVPTFRPDAYLDPARPEWRDKIRLLGEVSGLDTTTYAGYIEALESRRAYFKQHGATASDHGALDAGSEPLAPVEAERLYARA
ncbi:MAG TPA: glucuronate isomerase, partial [Actinopolymorphaceae bacterium]